MITWAVASTAACRIVALDETVLGFHDAAFGIGEVLLRFGIGLVGRRGGRLSQFLAALASSPFLGLGLRFGLGRRGGFRLGLQFGLRRPDLLDYFLLVRHPVRHLLAAPVAAKRLVLLGVLSLGRAQPFRNLGLKLRRPLGHVCSQPIALCLEAFALIFVPSSATWPSFASQTCSHSLRTCANRPASAFRWRLRKSETVREIRRIEPDNAHEVDPLARRLGDPARRVYASSQ